MISWSEYWGMGYNYEAVNGFKMFHFAHPLIGVLLGIGLMLPVAWYVGWFYLDLWRNPESWK